MNAATSKVYVSTMIWKGSHGGIPRGRGCWAFHRDGCVPADSPEIIWSYQTTFAEAKRIAVRVAAERGWAVLHLMP